MKCWFCTLLRKDLNVKKQDFITVRVSMLCACMCRFSSSIKVVSWMLNKLYYILHMYMANVHVCFLVLLCVVHVTRASTVFRRSFFTRVLHMHVYTCTCVLTYHLTCDVKFREHTVGHTYICINNQ